MPVSVATRQSAHFVVFGEPMGFELRIKHRTPTSDLERTGSARSDLNGFTFFYKQVSRTERTRLVVSNFAEFDVYGHVREY